MEGSSICIIISIITAVVLILSIVLMATSFTKIESTEVGVEYKVVVAELNNNILEEGLNTHTPFSDIIKWPIVYQNVDIDLRCNSLDGLKINLAVSYQFIPKREYIYELTESYKDFESYKNILVAVSRSSIRHTCSDFTSDDFQKNRSMVHESMEIDIKEYIDNLKSTIVELQLRNIDRPLNYENAVQNSESARSDITLALNERKQKLTAADTLLVEAKQYANKTLDSAMTQSELIIETANIEADTIINWYNVRDNVYKNVKDTHKLTDKQLLSYIGNKIFSTRGNLVMSGPSDLYT